MNIVEALKQSKDDGNAYQRDSAIGCGWLKYKEGQKYHLNTEDLLADDWNPVSWRLPSFASNNKAQDGGFLCCIF